MCQLSRLLSDRVGVERFLSPFHVAATFMCGKILFDLAGKSLCAVSMIPFDLAD